MNQQNNPSNQSQQESPYFQNTPNPPYTPPPHNHPLKTRYHKCFKNSKPNKNSVPNACQYNS